MFFASLVGNTPNVHNQISKINYSLQYYSISTIIFTEILSTDLTKTLLFNINDIYLVDYVWVTLNNNVALYTINLYRLENNLQTTQYVLKIP